MNAASTKEAWRDGVQRVNDEAAGLLTVDILSASAAVELAMSAPFGDYDSYRTMKAIAQTLERVRHAPRKFPALCVCCPRAVRRISSEVLIGVATPAVSSPTSALGFVICERCAADRDGALDKAREGLGRIWPEVRPVAVTHPEGGRA